MSLPDRRYWRDPQYWRWWWRERLSSGDKLLLALAAAGIALIGGIITADWLSYDDTSETLTVPVISTVGASRNGDSSQAENGPLTPPASASPARVVTEVLTSLETTTFPAETKVVTVRRNGRTLVVPKVIAKPGQTVTHQVRVPGPVRERVVTSEHVDTVVRTQTQTQTQTQTRTTDRLVTVTSPAETETISRTVTQPSPTVTQTNVVTVHDPAQVVTVTRPVTVTNEVTVTVTETVKK